MTLEIHLQMEAMDGLMCGNLNFPATALKTFVLYLPPKALFAYLFSYLVS